jgi:hypothetical protein
MSSSKFFKKLLSKFDNKPGAFSADDMVEITSDQRDLVGEFFPNSNAHTYYDNSQTRPVLTHNIHGKVKTPASTIVSVVFANYSGQLVGWVTGVENNGRYISVPENKLSIDNIAILKDFVASIEKM